MTAYSLSGARWASSLAGSRMPGGPTSPPRMGGSLSRSWAHGYKFSVRSCPLVTNSAAISAKHRVERWPALTRAVTCVALWVVVAGSACASQPEVNALPVGKAVFTRNVGGNFDLWMVTTNGVRRLTTDPAADFSASWSPDGASLVFVSDRSGNPDLYILELRSRTATKLTDTANKAEDAPAWSPNGDLVAFVREGDLYVSSIGQRIPERRLTSTSATEGSPEWAPDGVHLLFERGLDLHILDLTTGDEMAITDGPDADYDPSWSWDGSKVVFTRARMIASLDRRTGRVMTILPRSVEGYDRDPYWGPRGLVLFASDRRQDGSVGLFIVHSGEDEPVELAGLSIGFCCPDPQWSHHHAESQREVSARLPTRPSKVSAS